MLAAEPAADPRGVAGEQRARRARRLHPEQSRGSAADPLGMTCEVESLHYSIRYYLHLVHSTVEYIS